LLQIKNSPTRLSNSMAVNKYLSYIAGLFIVALCFQSCKKGCTDVHAHNFDNHAKQEDGSCLYCDSSLSNFGFQTQTTSDNNYTSPYYSQLVLQLSVDIKKVEYTGNECPKLHGGSSDSCGHFYYTVTLVNLTPVPMDFSGLLEIQTQLGFNEFPISANRLQPGQATTLNVINSPCEIFMEGGFFDIFITNSTFTYH
jgi:hypothetical protein